MGADGAVHWADDAAVRRRRCLKGWSRATSPARPGSPSTPCWTSSTAPPAPALDHVPIAARGVAIAEVDEFREEGIHPRRDRPAAGSR